MLPISEHNDLGNDLGFGQAVYEKEGKKAHDSQPHPSQKVGCQLGSLIWKNDDCKRLTSTLYASKEQKHVAKFVPPHYDSIFRHASQTQSANPIAMQPSSL